MRGFEPIAWVFQAFSGFVLILLITTHFLLTHSSHGLLSYESVVERMRDQQYKIFYALLLIFVTFHAFNGLRAIILDTESGMRNKRMINLLTFILAILMVIYGLYLLSIF
ncbi:MAG: succinate dehydrogenase [Archaeoglobaceae archaeon]